MKTIKLILAFLFFLQMNSFSQSFDARNDWFGDYKGNVNSKFRRIDKMYGDPSRFKLNIFSYKKFIVNPGHKAPYYKCGIGIPDNYRDIRGLIITKEKIEFSPTRRFPYGIKLIKVEDEYGDMQVKGTIEYYKVLSNGELSLLERYYNLSVYME